MRQLLRGGLALAGLIATAAASAASEQDYGRLRERMAREIETEAAQIGAETGRPQLSGRVMQVMRRVPRHRFVPPDRTGDAYVNRPLGIGHGQTISQPLIVALMTDLLDPAPGHTVLEVGTGSGYQAAVLAELVGKVYSIEIVQPLAEEAAVRLQTLGYRNVVVRAGDGYKGWPEHAPFDGIIVTAAAGKVPPPLIEQLKPGGRMVIPVGGSFDVQELLVIEKDAAGKVTTRRNIPVRFVPLTGDHE